MSSKPNPFNYYALEHLRAEAEGQWLTNVFVSPPYFDAIAQNESVFVFGESGSGKTAVRIALAQYGSRDGNRLIVDWHPTLPSQPISGSQTVRYYIAEIFNACSLAVVEYLGSHPETLRARSSWVEEVVNWFVHTYSRGDLVLYLDRLQGKSAQKDLGPLRELLSRPVRAVLDRDALPFEAIRELASAVKGIKLSGVWVMADGLEPWLQSEPTTLAESFIALLSTIPLFADPDFSFKMMLPVELGHYLRESWAIRWDRMRSFRLDWNAEQLASIVEQRVALTLGLRHFSLNDLCVNEYGKSAIWYWLNEHGGKLPEGGSILFARS